MKVMKMKAFFEIGNYCLAYKIIINHQFYNNRKYRYEMMK